MEHRAGWDAASPRRSRSLSPHLWAAMTRPGGASGERACCTGRAGKITQARIGNIHAPETTGKFVAATFEHDTARPVEGYAAPSSTPML